MPKWNTQSTHTDVAAFSDDPQIKKILLRYRLRFLVIVVAIAAIVGFGTKPAYRWFRERQINRNLEAAASAARIEDWGLTRDKARSVLIARPGDFEAFRLWHRALAKMGEPRTYMAAAQLFMDARATRADRVEALQVLALQAPQAVALSAFASLPPDLREETDVRAAIAPLLIHRGETAVAEKMLREAPGLESHPAARLELLRSLCSRPTPERIAEARTMFAKLTTEDVPSIALEALLVLGQTPGGLVSGKPLPDLVAWVDAQPHATTQHHLLALEPMLHAFPDAAQKFYDRAIDRFLLIDPGVLGTWLIRHGQAARTADLLVESSRTSGPAYIARLQALLREKRRAEVTEALSAPPESVDLVELELARAAAARIQDDPAAETKAWNQALSHAAFDQSSNRFLEIGRYAGVLGASAAVHDAWVAAVRIGWGRIPLYRDLQPVFVALARQGRTEELLAIYRSLLRFEPQNPDLINNYHYLALLHGVASPAQVIQAAEQLIAAYPKAAEYHSVLAMACLMDQKPEETLRQLPVLASSKRIAPIMRQALEGTALLATGDTARGRPMLEGIDWHRFLRCEGLAFRRVLIQLAIQDLPLPELEVEPPNLDPAEVPAWKKAVERLEQERAKDVLPPLPVPTIPGAAEAH